MNSRDLFDVWAPEGVFWSEWVKPVLFATEPPLEPEPERDWKCPAERMPTTDGSSALIVELPSYDAIRWALAFAGRGYRPVLLHNVTDPGRMLTQRIEAIWRAICSATPLLAAIPLGPDAPPAFILDSSRMEGFPKPGDPDLRWMVFPQDFPSGRMLLSKGIRRASIVQTEHVPAQDDLAHILRDWSRDGIALDSFRTTDGAFAPIDVPHPWQYRMLWHRALATLGLRRNFAAGFGAVVPIPGSGG